MKEGLFEHNLHLQERNEKSCTILPELLLLLPVFDSSLKPSLTELPIKVMNSKVSDPSVFAWRRRASFHRCLLQHKSRLNPAFNPREGCRNQADEASGEQRWRVCVCVCDGAGAAALITPAEDKGCGRLV